MMMLIYLPNKTSPAKRRRQKGIDTLPEGIEPEMLFEWTLRDVICFRCPSSVGNAGAIVRIVGADVVVGTGVGDNEGAKVGIKEGAKEGTGVGSAVGPSVGSAEGVSVGENDGARLGAGVGSPVGDNVGISVGLRDGISVGPSVGTAVGTRVGLKLRHTTQPSVPLAASQAELSTLLNHFRVDAGATGKSTIWSPGKFELFGNI